MNLLNFIRFLNRDKMPKQTTKAFLIALLPCLLTFSPLFSALNDPEEDTEEIVALKEWIASKRAVTVKQRGGSLSLSGEVRVEYITANEKQNGIKNLGMSSLHPTVASDQFDIEFNMMLDYRTDYNWASLKLEYDNDMGVFNGTQRNISLERAFFGVRIINGRNFTTDLEFGRRILAYTFDSKIQFGSFMDGLLIKYDQYSDKFGDFYIHGGPFILNEKENQFAYVFEIGLLNAFSTGFYGKYSFIDWDTKDFADPRQNARFQFVNSQFLLGYKFVPKQINKVIALYGAFLINAAARRHEFLNNRLNNVAGYAGIFMGEVRKKGDWSFDWNYQYVEPQAVPNFDFSGIGVKNAGNIGLYTINNDGSGGNTTRANAAGRTNFHGWRFQFLYAIANSTTISQSFQMSHSLDRLPTQFSYKQYKFELIYAW